MLSKQFPVFLHLLADKQLRPGAVLLDAPSEAPPDALLLVAQHPDFLAFSAKFPCVLLQQKASHFSDVQLQALHDAGCQWVEESVVFRSDALTRPVLPAQALWLDGNWVTAPPSKPTTGQSASRVLALKLVQLVVEDADTRDIENVFRQDPTLSYHLLKLVNSPGMGASRRITSFSQAILMLGRQQLRRWLNLMLFSARDDDHRAAMLQARVTWRSRRLELLAKQLGLDRSDQELAFMAGMFSMLGILFGLSLPDVFKPLKISDVLEAAVLRYEGEIGRLLKLCEWAERHDDPTLGGLLDGCGITHSDFNLINLQACHWMVDIVCEKQGGAHD